jgi:hypothetical protein
MQPLISVISCVAISLIMCTRAPRPQAVAASRSAKSAQSLAMPALTRRRSLERSDCWHIYYGDVRVGTIAARAGVPVDVDQWGWQCGLYPPSHHGRHTEGTAETFEQARAEFEAAWKEYSQNARKLILKNIDARKHGRRGNMRCGTPAAGCPRNQPAAGQNVCAARISISPA